MFETLTDLYSQKIEWHLFVILMPEASLPLVWDEKRKKPGAGSKLL